MEEEAKREDMDKEWEKKQEELKKKDEESKSKSAKKREKAKARKQGKKPSMPDAQSKATGKLGPNPSLAPSKEPDDDENGPQENGTSPATETQGITFHED